LLLVTYYAINSWLWLTGCGYDINIMYIAALIMHELSTFCVQCVWLACIATVLRLAICLRLVYFCSKNNFGSLELYEIYSCKIFYSRFQIQKMVDTKYCAGKV